MLADKVRSHAPRPEGLEVLIPSRQDDTRVIDIVFIHGLGGHALKSWWHAESKASVPWIADYAFLGDIYDKARIMGFGYNADFRRKSMTPSVIFLGTPHEGSEQADNLQVLLGLASLLKIKVSDISEDGDTVTSILRNSKTDIFVEDDYGDSALHCACREDNQTVLSLLLLGVGETSTSFTMQDSDRLLMVRNHYAHTALTLRMGRLLGPTSDLKGFDRTIEIEAASCVATKIAAQLRPVRMTTALLGIDMMDFRVDTGAEEMVNIEKVWDYLRKTLRQVEGWEYLDYLEGFWQLSE
ncbi:hypothetical protein LIA77_05585 [Sarocladium implicatum]|nr:hypothetical protein LIA77_05585 [Sarocladium implicatum]